MKKIILLLLASSLPAFADCSNWNIYMKAQDNSTGGRLGWSVAYTNYLYNDHGALMGTFIAPSSASPYGWNNPGEMVNIMSAAGSTNWYMQCTWSVTVWGWTGPGGDASGNSLPATNYVHYSGNGTASPCGDLIIPLQFTPPNPAPCTTNITFTARNNLGVWQIMAVVNNVAAANSGAPSAEAGSVQQVAPGQTYNYTATVPCDHVNDFTIWATGNYGDDNLHDTGQKGNGLNGSGTNGSGSNTNSTSGSGLNPYSGTNSPGNNPVSPTTNILWSSGAQGSDTAAVASAVRDAANVLYSSQNANAAQAHADAMAIKAAVNSLPSQLTNSTGVTVNSTNAGGNSTLTNYATQTTLAAIAQTLTNLTAVTNMDVASESTLQGVSNLLLGMATNLARLGTNQGNLNLTNYALESTQTNVLKTLAGMSNLMAGLLTNGVDTNHLSSEMPAGFAAAEAGTNALLSFMPEVPDGNGQVGSALSGWTVMIPYGGGYTVDLNPFHLAWVVSLAAFVRNLVFWSCGASLLYVNCDVLLKALQSLGATRQASASGQSVLGTNANLATALIMAALITLVMLGVPYFALNWYLNHTALGTSFQNLVSGSPFQNGAASAVAQSLWMVDQFFPLSWMVSCFVSGITFRVALGAVLWTVQTVTRFLVG